MQKYTIQSRTRRRSFQLVNSSSMEEMQRHTNERRKEMRRGREKADEKWPRRKINIDYVLFTRGLLWNWIAWATWTRQSCSDIHRPCRTVILDSDEWIRPVPTRSSPYIHRMYQILCCHRAFFFLDCTRISRITCWICIRFLDLAVRLSHKNINGLFTNLRHRTGSSTTIPFRIAYASAYQRDLEAMANLHSILIPDSWCCWRLPISFLANIESNRDQEIELSLLRTSIECSNWPIKFKSVAWSRFYDLQFAMAFGRDRWRRWPQQNRSHLACRHDFNRQKGREFRNENQLSRLQSFELLGIRFGWRSIVECIPNAGALILYWIFLCEWFALRSFPGQWK